VCSPAIDAILIGRPSVVASNWESTAQTVFGASATGGFGVVDVLRRLRRRFCGTRRPQALDLLVVHVPALAAGVVAGVAEPAPWMVLRPRA
jgi:hypothetical protein